MAYPPTFDHPWDITAPADTQLANLLGQDIRNLKDDVMQRFTSLAGTIANRPAPETVNATWGGSGYGLLYFSTDENKVYQWNGAAWIDVSGKIGLSRIPTVGGIVLLPTGAITIPVWKAPYACTATFVHGCSGASDGSGITVNAGKLFIGDFLAANLSVPSDGDFHDATVTQNSSFAIGEKVYIKLSGFSGAPSQVTIQVDFTRP
jgi:hypothetical protein